MEDNNSVEPAEEPAGNRVDTQLQVDVQAVADDKPVCEVVVPGVWVQAFFSDNNTGSGAFSQDDEGAEPYRCLE